MCFQIDLAVKLTAFRQWMKGAVWGRLIGSFVLLNVQLAQQSLYPWIFFLDCLDTSDTLAYQLSSPPRRLEFLLIIKRFANCFR